MKCLCVCLGFGREGKRERKRETLTRYLLGNMSCMHGDPTNKSEVAIQSQLFLFLGLGPRMEREERIFGLFAPKPNIRVSLGDHWPYKIKL